MSLEEQLESNLNILADQNNKFDDKFKTLENNLLNSNSIDSDSDLFSEQSEWDDDEYLKDIINDNSKPPMSIMQTKNSLFSYFDNKENVEEQLNQMKIAFKGNIVEERYLNKSAIFDSDTDNIDDIKCNTKKKILKKKIEKPLKAMDERSMNTEIIDVNDNNIKFRDEKRNEFDFKSVRSPISMNHTLLIKQSSPLFSDISFSEESIMSDLDDNFITPRKVELINKNYDFTTPTSKTSYDNFITPIRNNVPSTDMTNILSGGTLMKKTEIIQLNKNDTLITPTITLPKKETQIGPKRFLKSLQKRYLDKLNNNDVKNSISDCNSRKDKIFTDSDNALEVNKSSFYTPKLKSKKNLSQLIKTVPPKLQHDKLDFISSLMDNVYDIYRDDDARKYRINFNHLKEELALKVYHIYNERVFLNMLPREIDIVWSTKLQTTAGTCRCYQNNMVHCIRIDLATKILTDAQRLIEVLRHEMCHGAVWMINKQHGGHGPIWKLWMSEAYRIFPAVPKGKRCHNYDIPAMYEYWCLSCHRAIKRNVISIDLLRKVCEKCRSKFTLFVNQVDGETKMCEENKVLTEYEEYVKHNYKKHCSQGLSLREVIEILKSEYLSSKEINDLSKVLTAL